MKLGLKKLPILLSTIFFIVSCAFLFFIYKEVDKTKKATEELELKYKVEFEKRQEMKTLDKSVKILEEDKVKLDQHFANGSNIVPFLNTLEELAENVGANAEVSSVDILKDNQGLLVSVKAEGTFGSIYKLLELFENSVYELEITELDIQKVLRGDTIEGNPSSYWEGLFRIKLISFIP